jgi:hypothetical protein
MITEMLAACLPPPNVNKTTAVFGSHMPDVACLDMDELVRIRFAHQTKQAVTGVRTNTKVDETTPSLSKQKQSQKQHVQAHLSWIIRGLEKCGVGSSLGRAVRWQNSKDNTSDGSPVLTGNAANASEVAGTQAKKVG